MTGVSIRPLSGSSADPPAPGAGLSFLSQVCSSHVRTTSKSVRSIHPEGEHESMTEQEILLTPAQVAERLQLSVSQVYNLTVRQHRLPFIRISSSVRVRPSDLDAFLAAGTVEAAG